MNFRCCDAFSVSANKILFDIYVNMNFSSEKLWYEQVGFIKKLED